MEGVEQALHRITTTRFFGSPPYLGVPFFPLCLGVPFFLSTHLNLQYPCRAGVSRQSSGKTSHAGSAWPASSPEIFYFGVGDLTLPVFAVLLCLFQRSKRLLQIRG
jgi:hypothetical protein